MSGSKPTEADKAPGTHHLDHLPEHLHSRTDFDLMVPKDGVLLPCYSQVLSVKSNVIAQMFEDTEKDGWPAGVAKALDDATLHDASLFLALCHCQNDIESIVMRLDFLDLEGVMHISHKLDAPGIIKECDKYLLKTSKHLDAPVRWLCTATAIGLSEVAAQCRTAILETLVAKVYKEDNSIRKAYIECDEWDQLPAGEYEWLLDGVLRAFRESRR